MPKLPSLPHMPSSQKNTRPNGRVLPPSARMSVAGINEVRAILQKIQPDELSVLDPSLAERVRSPLWRNTLPLVLPTLGSVFVCDFNVEPAGLCVVERSQIAARVRVLAIAKDMRGKRIASKMLNEVELLSANRDLHWLWMDVPSDNAAAVNCALAAGYRRYLPQHLRLDVSKLLPIRADSVTLEPLEGNAASELIHTALLHENEHGDAWISDMFAQEMLPRLVLPAGKTFLCRSGKQKVGAVYLSGTPTQPQVWLWLDTSVWNSAAELSLCKAALDTLRRVPESVDIRFGSSGHLRQSFEQFKTFGFAPVLEPRVVFAKKLATSS